MHELSIVESLIDQVQTEVAASGHNGQVVKLELVIGRISGVNTDSIRFAFELLAPETPLERAQLTIHEPQAVCVCRTCDFRDPIDEIVAECPICGSLEITFEGGQEMLLQSIELEDEASD